MKGLKRLFNKLFNCYNNDENDISQQNNRVLGNCESNDRTIVKPYFRLQRVQDSFREIFLMCMDPFI